MKKWIVGILDFFFFVVVVVVIVVIVVELLDKIFWS